jgi:hypothetical protein
MLRTTNVGSITYCQPNRYQPRVEHQHAFAGTITGPVPTTTEEDRRRHDMFRVMTGCSHMGRWHLVMATPRLIDSIKL